MNKPSEDLHYPWLGSYRKFVHAVTLLMVCMSVLYNTLMPRPGYPLGPLSASYDQTQLEVSIQQMRRTASRQEDQITSLAARMTELQSVINHCKENLDGQGGHWYTAEAAEECNALIDEHDQYYYEYINLHTEYTAGLARLNDSIAQHHAAQREAATNIGIVFSASLFAAFIHLLAGVMLSAMVSFIQNASARSSRMLWALLVAFYPCLVFTIPFNFLIGLGIILREIGQGVSTWMDTE